MPQINRHLTWCILGESQIHIVWMKHPVTLSEGQNINLEGNKWIHNSFNKYKHCQALFESRKQTKGGTFRTKCVAGRWPRGEDVWAESLATSLISGTNIKVAGQNWPHNPVLWPPHTHYTYHTHTYKHIQFLKIELKYFMHWFFSEVVMTAGYYWFNLKSQKPHFKWWLKIKSFPGVIPCCCFWWWRAMCLDTILHVCGCDKNVYTWFLSNLKRLVMFSQGNWYSWGMWLQKTSVMISEVSI